MRLKGKVAVLTGGAGGIGRVIARRYLEEGACVILTGRTASKLAEAAAELKAAMPSAAVDFVAMDGSDPGSLAQGAKTIRERHARVDILINNAGSAGPRQELANIPLTRVDLERLKAAGSQDTETLRDAVGSLLGSPWLTTQALLPLFARGASVINVSTVFSRTEYYGRVAYVAPKAALNTLTRLMAVELGSESRGIRVNTVYPGPVESERIHSVFATMDKLKGVEPGTTGRGFVEAMRLRNPPTGLNYLTKEEIADTIVFLGSDESTGFSGHDFEVTHGLRTPADSFTEVISRPNLRVVDLEGRLTWILAGDQVEDALMFAGKHHEMGSDILLTFSDPEALAAARAKLSADGMKPGYTLELLDPLEPAHWQRAEAALYLLHQLPRSVVVLPAFGPGHFGAETMTASPGAVQSFFDHEICGAVAVAQKLDQLFNAAGKRLTADPVVVFATNPSDGKGSAFERLRRAAVRQMIRVWRHEGQLMVAAGKRLRRVRVNQLIRYKNEEAINLDLACEWAVSLSNGLRHVRAIDLSLAPTLAGSLQSRVALNWERQALRGLHLRKVALITGGSEGIGRETARLLALSGARVAIAARSLEKLEKARAMLIEELRMAGYSDPESRVLIIPGCDVADAKALETMTEQTLARFGRIDYLINNAGIAGVEQMVADMPIDAWERTLRSNLVSNYDLILRALPVMKKQKFGHILNVSSHFGGVKNATVGYPNRSDYAVSKAGQRALAEALAVFLGPDVQINAVAPGPVDGIRLRGTAERPGLYARRARLILENKRANLVYGALVATSVVKGDMARALSSLAGNRAAEIAADTHAPEPLRALAHEVSAKGDSVSERFLLTRELAAKILDRLGRAGLLPKGFSAEAFLAKLAAPLLAEGESFFPREKLEADALKIRGDVLRTLALARMPSENDVAREMVFYLANRNVTGETLHPSCGLMLEKLTMSGDFVARAHPDLFAELRGQTVLIVGDSMAVEMAELAAGFIKSSRGPDSEGIRQVAILALSASTRDQVAAHLEECGLDLKHNSPTPLYLATAEGGLDAAFDAMVSRFGSPGVVVSLPTSDLPVPMARAKPTWESLPGVEEFARLVRGQITCHLEVARRTSLIDGCRTVFVTPRVPKTASPVTAALAGFVRTTLRPLTVTAGQEGARFVHKPVFNQIDVTSMGENGVGMARFVEAVLLMSLSRGPGAPAPGAAVGITITV